MTGPESNPSVYGMIIEKVVVTFFPPLFSNFVHSFFKLHINVYFLFLVAGM